MPLEVVEHQPAPTLPDDRIQHGLEKAKNEKYGIEMKHQQMSQTTNCKRYLIDCIIL